MSDAASRPKEDRSFISRPKFDSDSGSGGGDSQSRNSYDISSPVMPQAPSAPPKPAPAPSAVQGPHCKALYDFEPGLSTLYWIWVCSFSFLFFLPFFLQLKILDELDKNRFLGAIESRNLS